MRAEPCPQCRLDNDHEHCVDTLRPNNPYCPCWCRVLSQLPDFDGETYEPGFDYERLGRQWKAVYSLMSDGKWRTLFEVEAILGFPPQSISARLRDFRKAKFGGHEVERRYRGDRVNGLFEYRLLQR